MFKIMSENSYLLRSGLKTIQVGAVTLLIYSECRTVC